MKKRSDRKRIESYLEGRIRGGRGRGLARAGIKGSERES